MVRSVIGVSAAPDFLSFGGVQVKFPELSYGDFLFEEAVDSEGRILWRSLRLSANE